MKSARIYTRRAGVSLLEVLISIGVIALGIFGVASLIPVAQFQVAQGTTLDRIAAIGPSAAAEFRIRNMGSPRSWAPAGFASTLLNGTSSDGWNVQRRAFVIDPLGFIQGKSPAFPASANSSMAWVLPRINLLATHIPSNPLLAERAAQKIFYLADDIPFDRPTEQQLQPRRQYFINAEGRPTSTVPGAQLSWFATLSPVATYQNHISDEFLLSIVVCKGRTTDRSLIANTEHDVEIGAVPFPGEIQVVNDLAVTELAPGDWIMVGKSANYGNQASWRYRWTQIIGTSDKEYDEQSGFRTLSISNDDWIGPGDINASQNKLARVFFVQGVESVFERTIRLQNTTAWDD